MCIVRKKLLKLPTKLNLFVENFRQIVLPFFDQMIKAARAARKICSKIINGQRHSIFFFEIIQFSPNRPPCFTSDDKGRARSVEHFSIYNSFSYGLLKKKGARSAEIFQIWNYFSQFC